MIRERTSYFAKPGKEAEVLELRRRASRLRVRLGLAEGTIWAREPSHRNGPDVQWECSFETLAAQRKDMEARAASSEFGAIRETMQTLIDKFERHLFGSTGKTSLPSLMTPQPRVFKSGDRELAGFLYLPEGEGPFPAMVLNHGSGLHQGSTDVSKPSVASVLVRFGLACFFPHRAGYGNSSGTPWREQVTAVDGSEAYDRQLAARLDREAEDVVAALDYLQTVEPIASDRIGVMGSSFGGTVSLLAAAKASRFRCVIDFAGAAMNWERTPGLRQLMIAAAGALTQPILLIQAENDYSIAPTRELARTLEAEGHPYQATIYPPFGANRDEGHLFERAGTLLWKEEVRDFLERWL